MSSASITVPPDSTGKSIATVQRTHIHFDNKVGNFEVGDLVQGAISGANGTVTAVVIESATAGNLYLEGIVGTFEDNEALQVSAVTIANAALDTHSQETLQYQKVTIADPENPDYIQKIDRFGATVNTFTNGSPVFAPFGAMIIGEKQKIKSYQFSYDAEDSNFSTVTAGAGASTFETTSGTNLLTVSNASGDSVQRTTHFYHPYAPGIGNIIQMAVQIGDSGKANCRRRWGFYDDNDGLYWELDGTQLSVVLRSSTTGSVVDTVINQANFNQDQLDGSDSINFNLDPSKGNIYNIDFQWLGTGKITYSVSEPSGTNIIAHRIENANNSTIFPYMRTATLPIRYEMENTGATASGSEMRVNCIIVQHTSKHYVQGPGFSDFTGPITLNSVGTEVPIAAYQADTTFLGQTNRAIFKGGDVRGNVISGDGSVLFQIRQAPAGVDMLTGEVFANILPNISGILKDTTATAIIPATSIAASQRVVSPGNEGNIIDTAPVDSHGPFEFTINAQATASPTVCITATLLDGTSAEVTAILSWEEVRA